MFQSSVLSSHTVLGFIYADGKDNTIISKVDKCCKLPRHNIPEDLTLMFINIVLRT
jgi:hypothetical protein